MPRQNFGFGRPTAVGAAGGGGNAFGSVPGPVKVPPSQYQQVSDIVPNFGQLTSGVSDVVGSELEGQVSPATLRALQNAAATFGVTSGMPGSGLQQNGLFANIAGWSEGQQRKGVQDYLNALTSLGNTVTNPNLVAQIAERNSTMAAAPDPRAAAEEQLRQWMAKFKLTNASGFGGPSGGTGAWVGGGRPPDAVNYSGGGRAKDALGFDVPPPTSWWADRAGTVSLPWGAGGSTPAELTASGANPWFARYSTGGGGGNYDDSDIFGNWDTSPVTDENFPAYED